MAIEVNNENSQDAVKIKFTANTCWDRKDYGPDYDEDTVAVPKNVARAFIAQGRAIEAPAETAGKKKK